MTGESLRRNLGVGEEKPRDGKTRRSGAAVRLGIAHRDPRAARGRADRAAAGRAVVRGPPAGALDGRGRAAGQDRRPGPRVRWSARRRSPPSGRGCPSCSRSSRPTGRCRCRPTRPASRPRRAGRARRRPGCRGTRRTGPTGTAGPSPRCCAPCARPRRCAGSATRRRRTPCSAGSGCASVMALLEPLADESVPAVERLCVVFGRLLRLRSATGHWSTRSWPRPPAWSTTTRRCRPSPGRRPRSARSTPATPGCWRRC